MILSRATADMLRHDLFDGISVDVPTVEGSLVEKDFLDVLRELVSIPDAEVGVLVSAQEETFRTEWRKQVIHSREPLGHAVVVRVLGLEAELE